MANIVIADKSIGEVKTIFHSNEYMAFVFDNPVITQNGDKTKIFAKYNKDYTLSKYGNNDFINLVKNLFTMDIVVISIDQEIIDINNGFKIRQVLYVEAKDNDLIFFALLSNFKILIEIDVTKHQDMTNITLANVKIIENNDFTSNCNAVKHVPSCEKCKLKKIEIDKYLMDYDKRKDTFFQSDVKYSDNIVINILNIVINNAITSEYMRNICEYFSFKNIDIYSI